MSDEQKQTMKEYQKEYRNNMSDEQKQKYKENRNKHNKDKYNKMTDEQKQRYKENKRNKDINDKKLNSEKIIITIIEDNNHFNDVIKL